MEKQATEKQVIAECASLVAFTRSSPGDYQCCQLLQANWPPREIGTGLSPFCLSVCLCPFLFLVLVCFCGFLFSFLCFDF